MSFQGFWGRTSWVKIVVQISSLWPHGCGGSWQMAICFWIGFSAAQKCLGEFHTLRIYNSYNIYNIHNIYNFDMFMMMNYSQIPALVKTQEVQFQRHLFRCQTSALLNTTSFLCKSAKLQKWGSMQAYKLDWLTCHSLQARKVGTLVSWATENLST